MHSKSINFSTILVFLILCKKKFFLCCIFLIINFSLFSPIFMPQAMVSSTLFAKETSAVGYEELLGFFFLLPRNWSLLAK